MAGSRRSLILVEGDSQARMQGQYCYIDGRNLSWKVWEIFAVVAESGGQTGKGGWVCGRKTGCRRRRRERRRRGRNQALPWVAPSLPQVRTPSSPPPPSTSDLRSLFVRGHSSTWPHDPVTPSSSPGALGSCRLRAPPVAARRSVRTQLGTTAIMPPEVYRAELVCLTETEEAGGGGGGEESGTFMSDFAREVAAGGGLSDTDPVFKSDFASLVHSSYREELVRKKSSFRKSAPT